jgi:spoIIIJ-associated protein
LSGMKLPIEEVAVKAEEFLGELIRRCNLHLRTRANVEEEDCVRIELLGEDAGLVLADSARLLYAMNHLVNQIFYRQARGNYSFLVDCGNYRSDRTAELELLARKAAEKAQSSRATVSLQPMPSSERRIIHLALAEESGVRTESEGSGRFRRVLIVPA